MSVRLVDQSPHASAEPGAERRGCARAVLAGGADERDRFRHLVAQQILGELLRAMDGTTESVEIASLELASGVGHEPRAFLDELIESVDQLLIAPKQTADVFGRVAR